MWLPRIAVILGVIGFFSLCAIAVNVLAPGHDGSPRPTLDPSVSSLNPYTGLMFSNRTDVAICVDAVHSPPRAAEALRQEVLDTIPAVQAEQGWSRGHWLPEGPVRVDIGCPGSSRDENEAQVVRPSDYKLFLNILPESEVPSEVRPGHDWSGGSEVICSGDSCFEVTESLFVSDVALCNPDWLTSILKLSLGVVERLTLPPVHDCP